MSELVSSRSSCSSPPANLLVVAQGYPSTPSSVSSTGYSPSPTLQFPPPHISLILKMGKKSNKNQEQVVDLTNAVRVSQPLSRSSLSPLSSPSLRCDPTLSVGID